MEEPMVAFNNRDATAETAHGLGKLKTDIAASDHEQMFRDMVQLERFNMRERFCFRQSRHGVNRRARAGIDEDFLPAKHSRLAFGGSDFDGFGAGKTSGADDQVCPAFFIEIEMQRNQTL